MTPTSAPRVAIVTGANRNIGASIARRLAADGAAVVINHPDSETRADADTVLKSITEAGGAGIAVQADVGDEDAVKAMVARAEDELGPPSILVNNAAVAVARQAAWDSDSVEEWERILRVNVIGAYICARAAVPAMRAGNGGSIINISSITAIIGRERNLPYVASKAALMGMTRALARELGPDGIRVNAVLPGAITTPQQEEAWGPRLDPEVMAKQALKHEGRPTDIASVVAFLASENAGFITGQAIVVDGGWTMR